MQTGCNISLQCNFTTDSINTIYLKPKTVTTTVTNPAKLAPSDSHDSCYHLVLSLILILQPINVTTLFCTAVVVKYEWTENSTGKTKGGRSGRSCPTLILSIFQRSSKASHIYFQRYNLIEWKNVQYMSQKAV